MSRFHRVVGFLCLALASIASALRNPIIPGWNPDPHVLRVDDTYYIAVSSFLTYPGVPIYKSKDLSNWELVSHALDNPKNVPITGVRNNNGVWAPSLSYIDGLFYMTSMAMTGSDPDYRTWPRIFWVTSPDLKTWSEPVWSEPLGIDPHLFKDPVSGKSYLSLMGLNNGYDKLWGITQCEVNLENGKCVGPYRNIWNGTLPVTTSTRPEGPKLFYKDGFYYLLIAEGGTGVTHRATIARSDSPEGPWESSPTNPLIFNGANTNLTVSATGHATFADTPDGKWFATFLAKRNVGSYTVLGRETFFAPVEWEDGWPTMNNGEPVLLSQRYPEYGPDRENVPKPYVDNFDGPTLDPSWYQLRSPYTENFSVAKGNGVVFVPNAYTLSDRDTPAAILRKQKSVNMTFTATLLPTNKGLGPCQSVGISAYSMEQAHQDIGLRGCSKSEGICVFVDSTVKSPGPGTPPETTEFPVGLEKIPNDFKLHIRARPTQYSLGYSTTNSTVTWVKDFSPSVIPVGFDGVMFVLFASGNTLPWPYDGPEVGFSRTQEEYFEEGFKDYLN
uniref:Beta-xylosidase C-terminal Concanavalin A-like domain-containing protein n=1 Tax=Bionectria ochroleuca TaxID=29856 RepID=A0A8H7K4B0_BIOOC